MARKRRAFITGASGQDGSYLSEFLLEKGYEVGGLVRRNVNNDLGNVTHLKDQLTLYYGDLASHPDSIVAALSDFKPDEIYNLAAQSHPGLSFGQEIDTFNATGASAVRVFKAAKNICPEAKIYQASTSELFGQPTQIPQNEKTPFNPANPYAAAKLYAHNLAHIYRNDNRNPQFIACGILFNHESPRRGQFFITRKVTTAVAIIVLNKKNNIPLNEIGRPIVENGKVKLGYLKAERDWGYSPDYVEGMWLMLQQAKADDFVLATGKVHTVEDLCQIAFGYKGLDWEEYVDVDAKFIPPVKTGPLVGDASKAKRVLGWKPKTTFEQMIALMVEADIQRLM